MQYYLPKPKGKACAILFSQNRKTRYNSYLYHRRCHVCNPVKYNTAKKQTDDPTRHELDI